MAKLKKLNREKLKKRGGVPYLGYTLTPTGLPIGGFEDLSPKQGAIQVEQRAQQQSHTTRPLFL